MKKLFILFVACFISSNIFAATVDELIKTHGKTKIVDFILSERYGSLTIEYDGELEEYGGAPSDDYITAKSVQADLEHMGMSVDDLDARLGGTVKVKKTRVFTHYGNGSSKKKTAAKKEPTPDPVKKSAPKIKVKSDYKCPTCGKKGTIAVLSYKGYCRVDCYLTGLKNERKKKEEASKERLPRFMKKGGSQYGR